MKTLQWKLGIILSLLILAVWLIYPSADWYTKTAPERQKLEASRLRPKRILNLGLDLKGGTHLLLELEVDKLKKKENVADAINRAIEIIRNRVDQYGVGETPINRQGERWISVDLPGISDTEEAENLIGKTAMLEFTLVDDSEKAQEVLRAIEDLDDSPFNDKGKLISKIAKIMPENSSLHKGKTDDENPVIRYYVLSNTPAVTGANLENARVETDQQFGIPNVGFTFDKEGGKIFGKFTGGHVGKQLAIVLDEVVRSAPVIKSRISGGSGVIEGNFDLKEARNLAIVLRAGALPAPVLIIEKGLLDQHLEKTL